MILPDLSRLYGSQVTPGGVCQHFARNITPNVKALGDADGASQDYATVTMMENVRSAAQPGNGRRRIFFKLSLFFWHILLPMQLCYYSAENY